MIYTMSPAELATLRQLIQTHKAHFREDFSDYLTEHSDIFATFVERTFDIFEAGWPRYSASAVISAMRWHSDVTEGPTGSGYKIRDTFAADFARLAMLRWPEELIEFFGTCHSPIRGDWRALKAEIVRELGRG